MTLDEIVEIDVGDMKHIGVANALLGSSSPDSNFQDILRPYSLKDGVKIMGTKAVVINAESYLRHLGDYHGIDVAKIDEIRGRLNNADNGVIPVNGYMVYFWDNTSEVHHRDIMLHCFKRIAGELANIYESEAKNAYDSEEKFQQALGLESALSGIKSAITGIYEGKKGSPQPLNQEGELMLTYSQGYQLSSSNALEENDLWLSRIMKIEISSGITKDQEKHKIIVPESEVLQNLRTFLDSMINVEYRTNSIMIPESLGYIGDSIGVKSNKVHRKRDGTYLAGNSEEKDLHIVYG